MKAIVLGGTAGIGKSIAENLEKICDDVLKLGSKDLDTRSIESVDKFCEIHKNPNILVLNTGGPLDVEFSKIDDATWHESFNRLFLSFSKLIKEIDVKNDGYIFLISSYIIKQPSEELIISSSIRAGFNSLFKSLSYIYAKKNIKFINIAPGPIKTKRLENLLKKEKISLEKFEKEILKSKIPEPSEIGKFVKFVVENKIISLNGTTITFDSNLIKGI